jgi:hypothetical protein
MAFIIKKSIIHCLMDLKDSVFILSVKIRVLSERDEEI